MATLGKVGLLVIKFVPQSGQNCWYYPLSAPGDWVETNSRNQRV